jgi:hypothetical protein
MRDWDPICIAGDRRALPFSAQLAILFKAHRMSLAALQGAASDLLVQGALFGELVLVCQAFRREMLAGVTGSLPASAIPAASC